MTKSDFDKCILNKSLELGFSKLYWENITSVPAKLNALGLAIFVKQLPEDAETQMIREQINNLDQYGQLKFDPE